MTIDETSSCVNEKAPEEPRSSEKSNKVHEMGSAEEKDLEKPLECLTTFPVNDDLFPTNKTRPVNQDNITGQLSDLSRVCQKRTNSNDINQPSDDEYQDSPIDDVHDYSVNTKEFNFDTNFNTNTNDINESTKVDPDYRSDIVQEDDCPSESGVDPAKDEQDGDNGFISNFSTADDNHDEDASVDECNYPADELPSNNCVMKAKSCEQNINESSQKGINFNTSILTKDVKHDESGDESLDSFFDCVTLKQRSQSKQNDKLSDEDSSHDELVVESVVTRMNLSKLRNISLHENNSKEEHKTSLIENQTGNDRLSYADVGKVSCTVPPCRPNDSNKPGALNVGTVETRKTDHEHLAREAQQVPDKYAASYPFVTHNVLILLFCFSSRKNFASTRYIFI